MTRFDSSTNQTEAAKQDICICLAVDMDFPSGHIRLTDAIGDVSIGGYTYSGNGEFLVAGSAEESTEVVAKPFQITLSGVDASLISTVRAGYYQGRAVVVYLCFFDKTTQQLVDVPETLWEGRMDTIGITLSGDLSSMQANCEGRLRREPRIAYYTDADEQLAYTGDTGLDRVPKVAGAVGKWGDESVSIPSNPRWVPVGPGSTVSKH